ncbi:MAG TPA: glycosyltransferase [Candidatus Desulfofervidus auxilii]|uniref:Glycosyltransferase n=1 Tax=Desulfofervidus auxilii TaxID=1621989 RepID=A0A7C0U4A8_DESA2|nr:glycosyltransferase [Candidatus Desulfofervidus auxilii]
MGVLERYAEVAGPDVIEHLRQLAALLKGMKVIHVNSTRKGGGVAEILQKLVPLMQELGIDAKWEIITGKEEFFKCTKSMHNALQGNPINIPEPWFRIYEKTNEENAERLCSELENADMVFIHDPQPVPLLKFCQNRKGKWIWRCHIDISRPYRPVWKYFKNFVTDYDASIFSIADFAQPLPHPLYIIPPSIDPLSEKNIELEKEEVFSVYKKFGIDPELPVIVQISRFDRFKDPLGVIQAYRLTKKFIPHLQLVLAGGGATDDPEGEMVLSEVQAAAADDPNIHVLSLPPESDRVINALQRGADIVLQKSIKEGFGLTVTEAMWKGKPVIGGNTGGIRLQVINHHTGFLVDTPEGAALRIRYLLRHRDQLYTMGEKAKEFVRENFLITRHLRDYLTLMVAISYGVKERIELG